LVPFGGSMELEARPSTGHTFYRWERGGCDGVSPVCIVTMRRPETIIATFGTDAVTTVNDPPVNTVPSAQTTNEDTALVFSLAHGNAISVSDPDDADNAVLGDEPVQVTLTAASGTLTLGSTAGLSFAFADANGTGAGDGTADAVMTFRGTLS